MVHRDEAPTGAPCWIDLMTSDPGRSQAFYGDLFGWTVDDPGPEYGGYVNFHLDGVPVAGCMRNQPEMQTADGWSLYLAVEDAEKTVATATDNGATVIVPPMAVTDLGTMAVVIDAGGAGVGIWQPGAHKGFGVLAEPGAPAWFELHTRAYDASVAFYRDVFGWDTHIAGDSDDFRYTTFGAEEDALAGIMDASRLLPDGVPPHWAIYFAVDDSDAALARVVELGGSVLRPAEDTPYGRLAEVADPTGAVFRVVAG